MSKQKRFEEVYTQGMTPLLDSMGNVVVTPVSQRKYDWD